MPPTNATSSSTITSFSWWQCTARERASRAHLHPRSAGQPVRASRTVARSGANVRGGAPGPHEHADVDALGRLGEQLAQDDGRLVAGQGEVRRDRPAGDVDVAPRAADRTLDRGQRGGPVDEHLERVARPRRRVARGPEARRPRAGRPPRRDRAGAGGAGGGRPSSPRRGGRRGGRRGRARRGASSVRYPARPATIRSDDRVGTWHPRDDGVGRDRAPAHWAAGAAAAWQAWLEALAAAVPAHDVATSRRRSTACSGQDARGTRSLDEKSPDSGEKSSRERSPAHAFDVRRRYRGKRRTRGCAVPTVRQLVGAPSFAHPTQFFRHGPGQARAWREPPVGMKQNAHYNLDKADRHRRIWHWSDPMADLSKTRSSTTKPRPANGLRHGFGPMAGFARIAATPIRTRSPSLRAKPTAPASTSATSPLPPAVHRDRGDRI